jgi:two-component system, OmpR family, sensor kinase
VRAFERRRVDDRPQRAVSGSLPAGADLVGEEAAAAARVDAAGLGVDVPVAGRRAGLLLGSTRTQLLLAHLVLLVLAVALATFAFRTLLAIQLDDRVDDALRQEIYELERLMDAGRDPETAQPFESLGRVFDVFFRRNVPSPDEGLVAFVGGEVYEQKLTSFPLDHLPRGALAEWARFSAGGDAGEHLTGQFGTPEGTATFRAIRVRAGDQTGAFVVTILPDTERGEIRRLQFYAAVLAVIVVLLAGSAAWFIAGRILAPIHALTQTARAISESELAGRIEVTGSGEAADMGRTFNAMLDRLEAVYRSQREFLRAAGHELRTPLTVATGHLELLEADGDQEESRRTLDLVLDELRRMGRVVDDLHALAEAERADFLAPQPVELVDLAEQLLSKAAALGEREWVLDDVAHGAVTADPGRLAQAVLNLADNAVKNTDPGDTIAIGIAARGPDVRIWVRDTGIGIPPEDQERIFERFERGAAAGRRYRGAGLGLAIAKTVAEAHGGRLELESEPGLGSRFTVVIPSGQE